MIFWFLYLFFAYTSARAVVECTNNGPCSYSGNGDDYICNNNGNCNCGNSLTCVCNNNGFCSCGNAKNCSCENNGACCHLSSTNILIQSNNGADRTTSDGNCILPAAQIVGITFGCVGFVGIISFCAYYHCRLKEQRRKKAALEQAAVLDSNLPSSSYTPPTQAIPVTSTPMTMAIPIGVPIGQQPSMFVQQPYAPSSSVPYQPTQPGYIPSPISYSGAPPTNPAYQSYPIHPGYQPGYQHYQPPFSTNPAYQPYSTNPSGEGLPPTYS